MKDIKHWKAKLSTLISNFHENYQVFDSKILGVEISWKTSSFWKKPSVLMFMKTSSYLKQNSYSNFHRAFGRKTKSQIYVKYSSFWTLKSVSYFRNNIELLKVRLSLEFLWDALYFRRQSNLSLKFLWTESSFLK